MIEILLVDDDFEVLADLGRALREAGHTVAVARDGLTALDAARAKPPDVVLADVTMPGLNGFQLCRRLRTLAETAHVPVFLMSGKADAADQLWAREVGARALLAKPIDPAEALAQLVEVAPRGSRGESKGGA